MELPDRDDRDDEAGAIIALSLMAYRDELLSRWKAGRIEPGEDFWAKFERDLADQLAVLLFGAFLASVRFHSGDSELDQDAIDAGIPWSTQEAQRLASLITQTSRAWVSELLILIAAGKLSDDDIGAKLDRIFGVRRSAIIASEVITIGQTYGGEWTARKLGIIGSEDTWSVRPELSRNGPCPVCQSLDGQPRRVWELIFPAGPPSPHVRCVCEIIYAGTAP